MPRTHNLNPLGIVILKEMYEKNSEVTAKEFFKECAARKIQPFMNDPSLENKDALSILEGNWGCYVQLRNTVGPYRRVKNAEEWNENMMITWEEKELRDWIKTQFEDLYEDAVYQDFLERIGKASKVTIQKFAGVCYDLMKEKAKKGLRMGDILNRSGPYTYEDEDDDDTDIIVKGMKGVTITIVKKNKHK